MTGSAFRAVAPVSAVCAAFAAQSSAYPPETLKPDVAPTCGSAAKNGKGDQNVYGILLLRISNRAKRQTGADAQRPAGSLSGR